MNVVNKFGFNIVNEGYDPEQVNAYVQDLENTVKSLHEKNIQSDIKLKENYRTIETLKEENSKLTNELSHALINLQNIQIPTMEEAQVYKISNEIDKKLGLKLPNQKEEGNEQPKKSIKFKIPKVVEDGG